MLFAFSFYADCVCVCVCVCIQIMSQAWEALIRQRGTPLDRSGQMVLYTYQSKFPDLFFSLLCFLPIHRRGHSFSYGAESPTLLDMSMDFSESENVVQYTSVVIRCTLLPMNCRFLAVI